MAIVIRELHIRVLVNASPSAPATGGQAFATAGAAPGGGVDEKDAIVAECVEQVLQILRDKTER